MIGNKNTKTTKKYVIANPKHRKALKDLGFLTEFTEEDFKKPGYTFYGFRLFISATKGFDIKIKEEQNNAG